MRLTMMVRADLVDKANRAIATATHGEMVTDGKGNVRQRTDVELDADPDARTFTVPLARPQTPDIPAAYWCSWDLGATGHSPQAVRTWLQNKGVPIDDLADDGAWVDASKRFAIFDGRHEPQDILTRLNLVTIDSEEA